jgi:hypothetical protein
VKSFCPALHSPRRFIVKKTNDDDTDGKEDDSATPIDQTYRQTLVQGFRTLDHWYRREQEVVDARSRVGESASVLRASDVHCSGSEASTRSRGTRLRCYYSLLVYSSDDFIIVHSSAKR